MKLRTSFERLSEVIASYEAAWGDVVHVETSTGSDSTTLQGSFEVPLRYCEVNDDGDGRGLAPDDVEFRDDGGLSLSFAPEDLGTRDPPTPAGVTTSWEDARIDDEAGLVVSIGFAIRPPEEATDPTTRPVENGSTAGEPVAAATDGVEVHDTKTGDGSPQDPTGDDSSRDSTGDGSPGDVTREGSLRDPTGDAQPREGAGGDAAADPLAETRNEDVPPFEDRPYLQELYESCDNFGEMSEIIEMDVSGETVRRYMIESGIHTPDSYNMREDETADGGENRSADTATDGGDDMATDGADEVVSVPDVRLDPDRFGLPGDMTIEETIDAVVESRSLHEVTRHLDIEHDQARDLLREHNLLDFVSYRLDDAPEAEPTYEEVASRIRRSSPQTV